MNRPSRPAPPIGDIVYYRGSDLGVIGTHTELRRREKMAKMIGTGKDPLGRYSEGLIFDVARESREFQDIQDRGWAKLAPNDGLQGGQVDDHRRLEIANAMVRGDTPRLPYEVKVAKELEGREHAVAHLDDPSADNEAYEDEAAKGKQVGVTGRKLEDDELEAPVRRSEAIATDTPVENLHRSSETSRGAKKAESK